MGHPPDHFYIFSILPVWVNELVARSHEIGRFLMSDEVEPF
jgi:hypothetical protein